MRVEVKDKKITPSGMIQGKEHHFRCSACNAPLADLMVNYDLDAEWNIVAECCHCGDKSYEQTVKGNFILEKSEETSKYSVVCDYDLSCDPMIIKTVKVADYVQKKSR